MKPEEGRGIPVDDNTSTLLLLKNNYYDVLRKKGLGTTPDPNSPTHYAILMDYRTRKVTLRKRGQTSSLL